MKTAILMVFSVLIISMAMLKIDRTNLSTNISTIEYNKGSYLEDDNEKYPLANYSEENLKRAENIHNSIMSDKRIKNAYIIVNKNYAIIGLESREDLKNKDLVEIEKRIIEVDKNIKNIVLVDDARVVDDLKSYSNFGYI